MVVLLLSLLSLVTPKLFCITDLILLQKKPLRMQNTMVKKHKKWYCSGFCKSGHICRIIGKLKIWQFALSIGLIVTLQVCIATSHQHK